MLFHSNKFLPLVKFIYENKNTQNDSVRIKPCGDVYLISHYLKLFLFIHPLNKKKLNTNSVAYNVRKLEKLVN